MRPASTFWIIQLSNSRARNICSVRFPLIKNRACTVRIAKLCRQYRTGPYASADRSRTCQRLSFDFFCKRNIILSLTVSRLNNRCIPCIFWVTAIIVVVTKYSNLFFPFTFFLNGSHAAFGYELIIRSETTDFMECIRDKLSSV